MLAGPLEIGFHAPLHIREERISSSSHACRLVYVSDLHLRASRSGHIAKQVIDAVRSCDANAVLLGGDLVDNASELDRLSVLVEELTRFGPVLAVGGNHDSRVGTSQVCDAVLKGGGAWIHNDSMNLQHRSRLISICGPDFAAQLTGDVRVLCAHNPRIWKTTRRAGYDLVLAGHLHGCQFVAFEFRDRLFPGAVFYPYNYLSHQSGATRLVVSRGISDLVPIRWRCPREVVLCYV
ncbi:putative metallophosphoesterase [Gimesia alba]|uniref:Putative metallophosphoesterase n=1 Tax=Gimesia alba TaxID=2527973 RepID=A0A517RIF7_9PLAN|nr:metallophosphoesterase family protein [Gimesia alba]QDT43631.1 putative metallophosphoesterase [Gimesia alba]